MADCICSALAVGGPGKPLLHRAGCPTSSLPAKPSSCRWLVTPSPGLPFSSPSEPQRDWVQREGSHLLEAGCTLQASRWAHLPLHKAWFFSHTPQASDRQPPCGLRCLQSCAQAAAKSCLFFLCSTAGVLFSPSLSGLAVTAAKPSDFGIHCPSTQVSTRHLFQRVRLHETVHPGLALLKKPGQSLTAHPKSWEPRA